MSLHCDMITDQPNTHQTVATSPVRHVMVMYVELYSNFYCLPNVDRPAYSPAIIENYSSSFVNSLIIPISILPPNKMCGDVLGESLLDP